MAKNTNANYWVSQRKSGEWSVQKEMGSRSSGLHPTQRQAFEHARELATNQGGEVIVKNRDGLIREKNTYGKPDPRETEG